MGRKLIPDEIKVVKGTFQKCRSNPNKPDALTGTPKFPKWLTPTAKKYFKALVAVLEEMNTLSRSEAGAIGLCAQCEDDLEKCNNNIKRDGMWIYKRDKDGNVIDKRKNPAVTQRNETIKRLQSLYAELGLTPASRSKVSKVKIEEEKDNPFKARKAQ